MAEAVAAQRVVQVLGSSAGGVARHVAQIAEALSEPGPAGPGSVVRVAGPAGLAADVAAGERVAFVSVPITARPRLGDLAVVTRLRGLARGADVLHAHGLRAGAFAVLAARSLRPTGRPRVVVTLHNLPVGGRGVRAVSAVLERIVARGADAVLGVSADLVDRARVLGATTVERALVPAPQRPLPAAGAAAVRVGLGIGADTALVVTVGRLAPQKGLDTLLDAATLLGSDLRAADLRAADRAADLRAADRAADQRAADRAADQAAGGPSEPEIGAGAAVTRAVVWVVAGDGPLHDHLAARIASLGAPVRLLGRRTDVPDLFAAADVVVSTAVWEGQPISVQEALQLGAPVVATDAGGTREVTGTDGAVLVPVGDAIAISTAIAELLADAGARAALSAHARARAAALPDLADVVGQLHRVYGSRTPVHPVE
ncbi:glycosyltransferase family 4 protein [Pengzhenrongella sicca]|uniref:Glycosyltransferase family 4 protein n=1 Tax=Pengzhenrongella sicca TaxID=2819238 RepID=A0A8A4ZJL0_9MICO|nr:glycosyltransferase family 4 protein [Pengzhenrongella sicca]QTE30717.1 glycosyltransferase family 4 protein [Pengzhenrongella sicca]